MDVTRYFEAPDLGTPRGAIVRVMGQEGTGKSSLGLSAPGPLVHLEFSENWKTAWRREQKRVKRNPPKEMHVCHLGHLLTQVLLEDMLDEKEHVKKKVREMGRAALIKFNAIWIWALMNYRTIVLDTDKAMAELVHFWYFGNSKGETNPSEYDRPNRVFEFLINYARDLPCKYPDRNVIFVGKMKEAWGMVPGLGKEGKAGLGKTGKWDPVGKAHMLYFPEYILETQLDSERAKMNVHALPTIGQLKMDELEGEVGEKRVFVNPYSMVVRKAGESGALYSERRLQGDQCTWGDVLSKLTGTNPEIWEEELPPVDGWEDLDPVTWAGEFQKVLSGVMDEG